MATTITLLDELRLTAKAATSAVQATMRTGDRYKKLNEMLATLDTSAVTAEAASEPRPGKPLSKTTTRFLIMLPAVRKRLEEASSIASLIAADLLAHVESLKVLPAPPPAPESAAAALAAAPGAALPIAADVPETIIEEAAADETVEEAAEASKLRRDAGIPSPEPEAAKAPGLLAGADADEGDFV